MASFNDLSGLPRDLLARLVGAIGEIHVAVDAAVPEMALMAALARLVPCHRAVLNAVRLRPNRIVSWSSARPERLSGDEHPVLGQYLHRHPALPRFAADPRHPAVRLADLADARAQAANPFISGFYWPNGLREQIVFPVGTADDPEVGGTWVVGINRHEPQPFSPLEVQACDLVRPHLRVVLDRLRERRAREAAILAGDAAEAAAGAGTAAIAADGTVVAASPLARRLLADWFGAPDGDRVPAAFRRALDDARRRRGSVDPCVTEDLAWNVERPDRSAQVRVHWHRSAGASTLAGLWLREVRPGDEAALARALGVTRQQAVVARWIAEGKSNPEIALILGRSSRTVEKHVEALLDRLGVENRTAIARAVRAVDG